MINSTDIYIVAAKRTPFGRFLGKLSALSPVELSTAAGEAVLDGFAREKIDLCVLGNVLSAGHGMNIARQAGLGLSLPRETPALTVNQMCASGLTSVLCAIQAIRSGDAHAVLCGGTESMSRAPRVLAGSREGRKLGDLTLVDTLLKDGLTDPTSGKHMGRTAEELASAYRISRTEQDDFALRSHHHWTEAEKEGVFTAERTAMQDLPTDEQPRPGSTPEKMGALRPAFAETGTITAANSSGLNDGAALLVVANGETCQRNGWRPLARITGWATVGCDPAQMGLGPVHAIKALLRRFPGSLDHYDAIEINEAFAAQVLACARELGVAPERLNTCGGAIAIGHPIGASGARLVVHLAHRIAAGRCKRGLASLCVGGGMGIALAMEKAD